jgi:ABC-type multidrug transport system fused ATPase/permease subunit
VTAKFKQRVKYLGQMFSVLWETDKSFLVVISIAVIWTALKPFPLILLAREAVMIVTDSTREFSDLVTTVIGLLAAHLVLSSNIIEYFMDMKCNLTGNKLGQNIFRKCIRMDYQLLSRKDVQEKREMAYKAIEAGRFANLTRNFRFMAANVFIIAGVVFIVASLDVLILIVSLLAMSINTVSVYYRKKNEYATYKESVTLNRLFDYYNSLSADFAYAKEIKTFGMEPRLIERETDVQNLLFTMVKRVFKAATYSNIVIAITGTALDICLYLLLGYKMMIHNSISIGDFTLYIAAIRQFNMALNDLFASFVDIDNNGQYLADYFNFMNIENTLDSGTMTIQDAADAPFTIEFKGVSFKYPFSDEYVLKNLNCTIKRGERISVVGENGSGKTTFVKLLMRLYDPDEGVIELNGVDIKDIRYSDYLKMFSAAFQDFKLFAFTIEENANALHDNIPREDVVSALEAIGLNTKVERLENGLSTYLYRIYDENGMELSGGEGQRLAIARALIKDAEIILLDEPTASLDPKVEAEIFKNFDKIVSNRTSVSISHRMASSRNASKIFVFQNGELVETGAHRDLLALGGVYAELYNLQADMYADADKESDHARV